MPEETNSFEWRRVLIGRMLDLNGSIRRKLEKDSLDKNDKALILEWTNEMKILTELYSQKLTEE